MISPRRLVSATREADHFHGCSARKDRNLSQPETAVTQRISAMTRTAIHRDREEPPTPRPPRPNHSLGYWHGEALSQKCNRKSPPEWESRAQKRCAATRVLPSNETEISHGRVS